MVGVVALDDDDELLLLKKFRLDFVSVLSILNCT